MGVSIPRIVIAGLAGDSGKTIVSLSLTAALRRQGLTVAPFKKGPDYIDSAWLGVAAGNVCRNLDTYLVEPDEVLRLFTRHAAGADRAVIEGNRGLFDGKDVSGSHSTAELAKLTQAPLILVVDTTKSTRTVAALIRGCLDFDPEVNIAGIVLNRIAGSRHEKIIRDSVAAYCDLPVVGAIPKLGRDAALIPGRHLGLVPPSEFFDSAEMEPRLAAIAEKYLDLDAIDKIAAGAQVLEGEIEDSQLPPESPVRVGYFNDPVFTFYYPENLEALRLHGARLVPVSSLADSALPAIDALYIGGGFPETHAERLAQNRSLMESVRKAAGNGLPIYAECGGLIYLCRSLRWKETVYSMAGVFPVDLAMSEKPIGHGYVRLEADGDNPYFASGSIVKGHEFHYSGPVSDISAADTCFRVVGGTGLGSMRDGLCSGRVLACYTHLHAHGVPEWAPALIANARRYADERSAGDRPFPAVNNTGTV